MLDFTCTDFKLFSFFGNWVRIAFRQSVIFSSSCLAFKLTFPIANKSSGTFRIWMTTVRQVSSIYKMLVEPFTKKKKEPDVSCSSAPSLFSLLLFHFSLFLPFALSFLVPDKEHGIHQQGFWLALCFYLLMVLTCCFLIVALHCRPLLAFACHALNCCFSPSAFYHRPHHCPPLSASPVAVHLSHLSRDSKTSSKLSKSKVLNRVYLCEQRNVVMIQRPRKFSKFSQLRSK